MEIIISNNANKPIYEQITNEAYNMWLLCGNDEKAVAET